MAAVMGRKLVSGALGALTLATDVARHVAWYVSYQIDASTAREDESQTPETLAAEH
jgi:hypothetical protein